MINRVQDYEQGIREYVEIQVGELSSSKAVGDAFCQWCLENIFDLSNDEALDAREASGSGDHSIDAIFETDSKITVVQTKYDSSHDWSQITKFRYDMKRIQDNKVRESDVNSIAQRAVVKIQDALTLERQVHFYYITNAHFSQTDISKLDHIDGNGHDFHFLDMSGIVNHLERKQQDIPDAIQGKWLKLAFSNGEILKFRNSTAVVAVSLLNLHDFMSQTANEDDLFASNVRQYLRGTKINQGIRQTIVTTPESFWIYNNGITIVCDDFKEEGYSITIRTPQIVNGCQTAKAISEVLSRKNAFERETIAGHVLVRIIKGADDKQKENITRFTNMQNAVRGKDFFSLDKFQRKLQGRFKKLGLYYEIQRGSYTALRPSDRAKYKIPSSLSYLVNSRFRGLIPGTEAIQSFAAGYKQLPAAAYGKPYELTPTGSLYDQLFPEKLDPEPRVFLYPFLVREWAKNNGYSRGGGGWRAHASFFFIYAYFSIMVSLFSKLGRIEDMELIPENVPLDLWDIVFHNGEVNHALLLITDDILGNYFLDSKVEDAIGQDVSRYLKRQEELNKHKEVLSKWTSAVLFSTRYKPLVEKVNVLLKNVV